MFSQSDAGRIAVRSATPSRAFHLLCRLLLASSLGGCLQTVPPPIARPDPADPAAHVAPVKYAPTIVPYVPLRPAAPSNWREQNGRVAPGPER